MSIQSSVNSALGSVEQTLLRAGTLLKTPEAEPETGEEEKTPAAKESTAPEQKTKKEASEAATNPAAQVIANGNMTAGAIAAGRVQAKQQQIIAAKSTSADRLAQLREMKAAARKDVRKIKSEERQIRRQLEKEGGGE